jgi:hypothetical protein
MTRHGTGCYTSQAVMKGGTAGTSSPPRPSRPRSSRTGSAAPRIRRMTLRGGVGTLPVAPPPRRRDGTPDSARVSLLPQRRGPQHEGLRRRPRRRRRRRRARARHARRGAPIVVFNPLAVEREDIVEADVRLPGAGRARESASSTRTGEVPRRRRGSEDGQVHGSFLAKVLLGSRRVRRPLRERPPAGSGTAAGGLRVSESGIENERYSVRLDEKGDIAALYDKRAKRNVLSSATALCSSRSRRALAGVGDPLARSRGGFASA